MKKTKFIFLFLMVFFMGFMSCQGNNNQPITRGEIVYELLGKIDKKIRDKYQLSSFGTLVGMPEGVVKELGLEFQIHKHLTVEEARMLLVNCADIFVPMVNADDNVSSYLENSPFSIKNVDIRIFILDPAGYPARYPYLTVVGIDRGILSYEVWEDLSFDSIITRSRFTETYEEAKTILNQGSE